MSIYGPFAPTPNPGYPTLSFPVGFEETFVDWATSLANIERLLVTNPMVSEKWSTSAPTTLPALPVAGPALTAALAGLGAGNVNNGTHSYVYTWVTGGRETIPAPMSNIVTTSGGDGQVALSGIVAGPTGTTARKIYRSVAGNVGLWSLLATIADNTTTIFADNIADGSLGVPPTCTFAAPPDSAGRFLTLIFQPGPSQLNLNVTDQNNVPVISTAGSVRSIVPGAGATIHYYSCSKFLYIQDDTDTQHLGGGMLTAFPEAEGGNGNYVYAHGTNNNNGGFDGLGSFVTEYFMLDNGAAAFAARMLNCASDVAGTQFPMQMGTGSYKYDAVELMSGYSGTNKCAGRFFNAYVCDASLAPGATRTLPIGNSGETGVFRVLGTPPQSGTFMRVMLRIA